MIRPRSLLSPVPEAFSRLTRRRARRRALARIEVEGISTDPLVVAEASPPTGPGSLWVAELSLLDTADGPLYLVTVLDAYSRRCLGWSASPLLRPQLVSEAVDSAAAQRWPAVAARSDRRLSGREVPLVVGQGCGLAGVEVAASPAGCVLDLAVAASFYSLMRRDLLDAHLWPSHPDAILAIDRWITHYYNPGLAPATPWAAAIAAELDELSL